MQKYKIKVQNLNFVALYNTFDFYNKHLYL